MIPKGLAPSPYLSTRFSENDIQGIPATTSQPHAVSNLVPEAMGRLRESMATSKAKHHAAAHSAHEPGTRFSARPTAAHKRAGTSHIGSQSISDIARNRGIQIGNVSGMSLEARLTCARDLVRSGARCDEALSQLHVPHQPDVYMLESQLLAELGMPAFAEGESCAHVCSTLGVTGGPAQAAFQLDVVTEIGVPLYCSGMAPEDVLNRLGVFSGTAYFTFRNYARDIESGRMPGTGPAPSLQISTSRKRASAGRGMPEPPMLRPT